MKSTVRPVRYTWIRRWNNEHSPEKPSRRMSLYVSPPSTRLGPSTAKTRTGVDLFMKGLTYHNYAFNMEDAHAHVPPDEPQERTVQQKTNKPVAARMNTHGRHFLITMVAPLKTCVRSREGLPGRPLDASSLAYVPRRRAPCTWIPPG
jgi:hypothetical protein